jgi:putative transposase
MIQRGYRFKLHPTSEQSELFGQFAGVCRLVYNLAFEQRREHWRNFKVRTGNNLNYIAQSRELTALRAEYDWIAAVSQSCQQQALRDLDRAYSNFFKGIAKYPSPRKRGLNDTFRFQGREVSVQKLNSKWSLVRLPKIGWVKFRDTRQIVGKTNNATISLASNGWHISFSLAIEHDILANKLPSVGIDRGVAQTLALSTGELMALPDSLIKLDRSKRRAQKVLSRRKRGSNRYAKARRRVAALQSRSARIRKDWHHRATLDLSERFGTVVLENLNTKGMTASAKGTVEAHGTNVRQKAGLNRSILNQGWHIFETLLNYKLEERGGHMCKVPAHYTSQTCSECGAVDKESRESQAFFNCQHCAHRMNADHNAAKNILRRNTSSMVVEEGHWLSCEAITGRGIAIPENPLPLGGGRC